MTTARIEEIDIGKEFSVAPRGAHYGVHYTGNADSGKRFREEVLKPVFTESERYSLPVKILLDTVDAYSAAFLKEAFGGLVREGYTTPEEIRDYLKFVFKKHEGFELYMRLILLFIAEAEAQKKQKREGN